MNRPYISVFPSSMKAMEVLNITWKAGLNSSFHFRMFFYYVGKILNDIPFLRLHTLEININVLQRSIYPAIHLGITITSYLPFLPEYHILDLNFSVFACLSLIWATSLTFSLLIRFNSLSFLFYQFLLDPFWIRAIKCVVHLIIDLPVISLYIFLLIVQWELQSLKQGRQ